MLVHGRFGVVVYLAAEADELGAVLLDVGPGPGLEVGDEFVSHWLIIIMRPLMLFKGVAKKVGERRWPLPPMLKHPYFGYDWYFLMWGIQTLSGGRFEPKHDQP